MRYFSEIKFPVNFHILCTSDKPRQASQQQLEEMLIKSFVINTVNIFHFIAACLRKHLTT